MKYLELTVLMLAVVMFAALTNQSDEVEEESTMFEPIPVKEMFEHDIDEKYEWYLETSSEMTLDFIDLDEEYLTYLQERCADLDIDLFVTLSLMFSESSFRADAVGDKGKSIGFFQINEVNWDEMYDKYGLDVTVPLDNIEAGLTIFSKLYDKYGDYEMAIQCYKCGESRGKRLWKEGTKLSSIKGIMERADEWREKAAIPKE